MGAAASIPEPVSLRDCVDPVLSPLLLVTPSLVGINILSNIIKTSLSKKPPPKKN